VNILSDQRAVAPEKVRGFGKILKPPPLLVMSLPELALQMRSCEEAKSEVALRVFQIHGLSQVPQLFGPRVDDFQTRA